MKVWLYYANAGGGHRGPAKAIAEELERRYKTNVSVQFIDLAETSWLLCLLVEQGYAFSVHSAEWLYAFLFELSNLRIVSFFFNTLASWLVGSRMRQLLRRERPDVIVATHFLVGPLVRALKKEGITILVHCVVTDPESASSVWFHYQGIQYITASEAIQNLALKSGIPTNHITILPPVIREKPFNKMDVEVIRDQAGLMVNKKTVLLVGGGNGFPNAEKVVSALLASHVEAQFVVVCGENKVLKKKIERLRLTSVKHLVVYGHVDFLPALISMSDVVIAKAGANTVFEVLMQDKPLIITHYIWGQEKGNVDFVVRSRLGFYEPRPVHVAALVEQCLYDKKTQGVLRAARREVNLKNGTSQVVDLVLKNVTNK